MAIFIFDLYKSSQSNGLVLNISTATEKLAASLGNDRQNVGPSLSGLSLYLFILYISYCCLCVICCIYVCLDFPGF